LGSIIKTILIIFAFFCAVSSASAVDYIFTWDANIEEDLEGYRLYQSDTPNTYTFGDGNQVATIPAGTETTTLTGNEVSNTAPNPPVNFRKTVGAITLSVFRFELVFDTNSTTMGLIVLHPVSSFCVNFWNLARYNISICDWVLWAYLKIDCY
jgi:hypothetical protein